jgi:hypothetical protein
MIVFDLKCRDGHTFEEWFASSSDYEKKAAGGLACPTCGDTHVEKALSAPRVNGGAREPAPAPCGLPQCGAGTCAFAGD